MTSKTKTKEKEKIKIEHYGEKLAAEIKDKGYSKNSIAKALKMSFNTLADRIEDGKFSQEQLAILVEKRYLG